MIPLGGVGASLDAASFRMTVWLDIYLE